MLNKRGGFTIIELVTVMVVLAILAVVALPKFYNFQIQAKSSAEAGVLGGVRSGIASFYASTCAAGACAYPVTLDATVAGVCSATNLCFANVLNQAVTSQWSVVTSGLKYAGPSGTNYTYTPATGIFQ